MWFPRPSSTADIALHESAGLGVGDLLRLLRDPSGTELRHKAGVAGATDGSARATTRLLVSQGLVIKADLRLSSVNEAPARAIIDGQRRLEERIGVWHPDKFHFLLRWGGRWHPTSACPEMQTLRSIEDADARLASYTRMLVMALRVSRDHRVGLDINPSNFGTLEEDGQLFYLDDEVYEPSELREIGEAIAARLTEHRLSDECCERWGTSLERAFRELGLARVEQREIQDGIEGYPVVAGAENRRQLLLESMRDSARRAQSRPRRRGRLTCVFGDVHANLAALDAVLTDAARHGVDDHLFLGDVVGYGPQPGECIDRLAELDTVACVRGNHDDAVGRGEQPEGMNRLARQVADWSVGQLSAEQRSWLRALPVEQRGDEWIAVHGAPRDPERFMAYVYELTFRDNLEALGELGIHFCFYGHTHVQFVHRRRIDGTKEKLGARDVDLMEPGDRLLINPGSVGQPRDGDPRAGYALWDRGSGRLTFQRVAYPVETTVRALRRAGLPNDLTFRLEMGR